jgi:PAS domain S-box-containing protein
MTQCQAGFRAAPELHEARHSLEATILKLRLSGMTAGLSVGISAAVVCATAAGAYLFSLHHFDALLDTARGTALAQGELMRAALEHQMMENERGLIARMVETFGRQPGVERVVILDRTGGVRFASRPVTPDQDLQKGSATCQACHRLPPDQRGTSRVIETPGASILRTVVPVRNRQECHGCHDPAQRVNGILILDTNTSDMRAAMDRDLRWMVAGTASITLPLIAIIAFLVRLVVLRRLNRFETTARLVAGGDLSRRVPVRGSDTISWLAREFNTMADSMTGLLTQVRDQRERLETVINSIDDGIVVLDASRRVIAANDAFLQRTTRSRLQVVGCGCAEIGSGVCAAATCPTLGCLRSGERQVSIFERVDGDGAVVWEEVHASPVRGPDGAVAQVVEVWRDISDRRAAEARLAESHRLASLGLLASGFSHELNTPLGTVLASVEGILRETKGDRPHELDTARVSQNAAIAREQLLRCRGITQHFLRMSRGQSSGGDVVDVGAALEAVARLIAPTARARDVRIDVRSCAGARVRVDETDIQHALMNLVLNAVQATAPGGHVTISAHAGDPVTIRIEDDGCGIAAEQQRRIFEPFYSLRKGGTGLGLFLSLNCVRQWGGDIVVASVAGEGSTFEVRLPPLAAAR